VINIKNRFILAFCAACRWLKRPPTGEKKRFLVVSTTGLGDTLWGTPALRALRTTFPDASIHVLTSPVGFQVLKNNPRIDALYLWNREKLSLFTKLRAQKFDSILLFHASQRAVLPFCHLLGASEFIGTAGINKGLDSLLTKTVAPSPVHEIKRRMAIVEEAGAQTTDPGMEIALGQADSAEVEQLIAEYKIPFYLPIVGIHPGAKDRFKQWPPSHFVEVGKRLQEELGCQIVVTGTPHEKELVSEIASQIPGALAVCHLSLKGLAALIKKMAVYISNDTGPMHLGFALKTPTVPLFSPTNPSYCGPYGLTAKVHLFAKPPTCSPCLKKRCRDPFCMLQIAPEEVVQAALTLFHKEPSK
jgi:ADP-heptose:LPS heptosyltransferase